MDSCNSSIGDIRDIDSSKSLTDVGMTFIHVIVCSNSHTGHFDEGQRQKSNMSIHEYIVIYIVIWDLVCLSYYLIIPSSFSMTSSRFNGSYTSLPVLIFLIIESLPHPSHLVLIHVLISVLPRIKFGTLWMLLS
jgi:hypothetical protein